MDSQSPYFQRHVIELHFQIDKVVAARQSSTLTSPRSQIATTTLRNYMTGPRFLSGRRFNHLDLALSADPRITAVAPLLLDIPGGGGRLPVDTVLGWTPSVKSPSLRNSSRTRQYNNKSTAPAPPSRKSSTPAPDGQDARNLQRAQHPRHDDRLPHPALLPQSLRFSHSLRITLAVSPPPPHARARLPSPVL